MWPPVDSEPPWCVRMSVHARNERHPGKSVHGRLRAMAKLEKTSYADTILEHPRLASTALNCRQFGPARARAPTALPRCIWSISPQVCANPPHAPSPAPRARTDRTPRIVFHSYDASCVLPCDISTMTPLLATSRRKGLEPVRDARNVAACPRPASISPAPKSGN